VIKFTPAQIANAAEALKIRRLARMPGMDRTAVMLNREPTHDEVAAVAEVARALGYAEQGMSPLVIAVEMET
jgi:hypothetical protein